MPCVGAFLQHLLSPGESTVACHGKNTLESLYYTTVFFITSYTTRLLMSHGCKLNLFGLETFFARQSLCFFFCRVLVVLC